MKGAVKEDLIRHMHVNELLKLVIEHEDVCGETPEVDEEAPATAPTLWSPRGFVYSPKPISVVVAA